MVKKSYGVTANGAEELPGQVERTALEQMVTANFAKGQALLQGKLERTALLQSMLTPVPSKH
jgi:hypothetical protein